MRAAGSLAVLDLPQFDLEDFQWRWRAARISALRSHTAPAVESKGSQLQEWEMLTALTGEGQADARQAALKAVFDNSRKLGAGLSRHLGLALEATDFSALLERAGSPCISGRWEEEGGKPTYRREACAMGREIGPVFCDYWREAVDGLVMGAGEETRFARYESAGHGGDACVDVLYEEVATGRAEERYGRVPPEVLLGLAPLQERLRRSQVTLTLLGLAEGVLFYRLESGGGPLCGAGGKLIEDSFRKELGKLFPRLEARDASPLAVYGGNT